MVDDSSNAGLGLPAGEEAEDAVQTVATDVREPSGEAIPACCVETIRLHVRFNPMMVCAECKNIIKCFQDERAYENYLKFCRSRRRPVLTGRVAGGYFTVAFRPYDTSYNR